MDLFDLAAKITLDSSEYERGLDNAKGKTNGFASTIGNGLKTAAKVGVAAVAAVGTATTLMAGAIVKGVGATAEYGDNIDKMSQKMGLSIEAYQEWDAVMQHSGTSMESMQASMKTLANAVENGNKAFQRIGLTQEELANMSQEEIFDATIAGLQNVEDETERTYLAGQLLGRGATELGALLNTSAEETQAMKDRVHELGGVMSDEAVKSAAAYQDQLQDMQTAFSGLSRNMLSEFMPSMTTVMGGLTEIFSGNSGTGLVMIEDGINQIVDNISLMLPNFIEIGSDIVGSLIGAISKNLPALIESGLLVIEKIADGILDNLPYLIKVGLSLILSIGKSIMDKAPLLMQTALDIIMILAQGLIENVGSLVDGAVTLISQFATFLGENADMIIQAAIDIILALFDALTDPGNISTLIDAAIFFIISLAEALVTNIPELISRIPKIVMNLVNAFIENAPKLAEAGVELILMLVQGIFDAYSALISAVLEILGGIGDSLGEWGKSAMKIVKTIWNGIKSYFSTIWNGIKSIFTTALTAVKNNISSVFNGIKSFFSNIWNGIKGIFSNSLNNIKTTVTSVVNTIKNAFSTGFNAAKNTVLSVFDAIKSGITNKLEAAKSVVSNMIEKIKGFFNFNWSLPKIKLPHFSVSGSANPIDWLSQGVPKIKIDWYRKAYNSPYLFDKQTVLPFADGFKGFGDGAGAEIVYGRDNLMRDIQEAVGGAGGYTQNVYITSPKQLSPSEIARQTRNATRNMVLSMRGV